MGHLNVAQDGLVIANPSVSRLGEKDPSNHHHTCPDRPRTDFILLAQSGYEMEATASQIITLLVLKLQRNNEI